MSYWYRGAVQYNGGPPEGFVWHTGETAAIEFVWAGSENFRDDPESDCHWVERRPMDCWERVPDQAPGRGPSEA